MSYHVAQRYVNWYFLGGIAAWEQSHMRKQFGTEYFLAWCFINWLVNHSLHTSPYVIYWWRNVLEKLSSTSNFRSIYAVTIELGKQIQWSQKFIQGYVSLLLVTTLSKFQFFVTNFAHSATHINEVCLKPLWPSCIHGVNSTSLMGQQNKFKFRYTQSRSVKTPGRKRLNCCCNHKWWFL